MDIHCDCYSGSICVLRVDQSPLQSSIIMSPHGNAITVPMYFLDVMAGHYHQ